MPPQKRHGRRALAWPENLKVHKAELLMCGPQGCAGVGWAVKGKALCARAVSSSATLDCAVARAGGRPYT
jgi:hypothetical protein